MFFDSPIRTDYDITKQQRTDEIDIVVRSQIQNPIYIIKHDDNATLFRDNLKVVCSLWLWYFLTILTISLNQITIICESEAIFFVSSLNINLI